ncbi:MAG TPA: hypothetical protein VIU82_00270 [Bosea sp. (in: a-proteobacteria)]
MRHKIEHFRDFPMPALRADAYYSAELAAARAELERHSYAFCDKSGMEYESGAWVSRYSNPAEYDPSFYSSRQAIFDNVFAWAIKSRAARLHNRKAA